MKKLFKRFNGILGSTTYIFAEKLEVNKYLVFIEVNDDDPDSLTISKNGIIKYDDQFFEAGYETINSVIESIINDIE